MTYKKAYTIEFIFYSIAVLCIFVFENSVLNLFLIFFGMVLTTLLKGYAKDNENKKETLPE